MNISSFITKGIRLKRSQVVVLIFLVCCEMVVPIKGWTQSFSDTGNFSFSGSSNPLRNPSYRQFLPGDGLKVGRMQIHPFLGVAEIFTDNVFRTKKQRQSDFLTTIAPGIQASVPFAEKHSFLFDYRAAQFSYAKFTPNNALTQNGLGQMRLNFPGGLNIIIQGDHVEGFDQRGADFDIQSRDITKWRATNFLSQARLSGPRGGIRIRSRYTRLHYKNNGQDTRRDRKNARVDLTGFITVTQGFSALLGTNISNNTYDQNEQLDSFSYGVFSGFEIAPTRQLSGEVRVGYTILNFDRAPVGQDSNVIDDPTDPTMTDPGDRLVAEGLNLGGRQQRRLTLNGNLIWRPTTRLSVNIRAFRNIRQSAVFNTSTFVQTGFSLIGSHQLTNRIQLLGRVRYSNSNFSRGRTDNRFLGNVGVRYRTVEWLGFGVNYYLEKRSSSESQFEYYSNTIAISAQALF